MPHHEWGDEFDFNGLEKAAKNLSRLYKKLTRRHIVYKEKYGTIRYEFIHSWITSEKEFNLFNKCLKHIVKKYPHFAGELVEDWIPNMDIKRNWSQFFRGVLWASCQEEWR